MKGWGSWLVTGLLAGGLFAGSLAAQTDSPPPGFATFTLKKGVTQADSPLSEQEWQRVAKLMPELPDGHTVRVEVTLFAGDRRYVALVTPLNAKGEPDGVEVAYPNWYEPALRQTTFRAGQRQGVETLYHDGTPKPREEIPWVNGRIHGVKKQLHPTGALANETTYENGVITGESRSFAPDGQVTRVVRFQKGQRHGEMVDYWPGRGTTIERVTPYVNGAVQGVVKAFYADGKLKWERPFRNNRQHGHERQFKPDGALERERFWIDGEPVSKEEFNAKVKK